MDFEVIADPMAVRQERRRTIYSLIALALVPASNLIRLPLVSVLDRYEAEKCAIALSLSAFVAFMFSPLWRLRDSSFYRCPQCDRRLPKVAPHGQQEPNVHFACEDCRVIWDLGWAWPGGGEGGG